MDHDGAVVEARALPERCPHDEDGHEVDGCRDELLDRGDDGLEHDVLHHEVLDRVSREAQLGEDGDRCAVLIACACRVEDRRGVGLRVGDRNGDRARGDSCEAVPVHALERKAHDPSLALTRADPAVRTPG